jgi:hypothetical protein
MLSHQYKQLYIYMSGHHSKGLATKGQRVIEECFDQSYDAMQFHATNLVPGGNYMLRVVLFERAQSLAVSVRSFRVGAIALPSSLHKNNAFITSLPSPSSSSAYEENNHRLSDASQSALHNDENEGRHEGSDRPMIRKGGSIDSGLSQENLVTIQTALKLALVRGVDEYMCFFTFSPPYNSFFSCISLFSLLIFFSTAIY